MTAEVKPLRGTTMPESSRERAARLMREAQDAGSDAIEESVAEFERCAANATDALRSTGGDLTIREELRTLVRDVARRLAVIRGVQQRRGS